MADRYVLAHIQNLPLLTRLSPEQLAQIATAFDILSVGAGQTVFQQGDPARGLYLLTQGRGVLYQTTGTGDNRVLAEVQENQFIGEAALFQGGTERMSLAVREDSVLLLLSTQKFQAVMASSPDILTALSSDFLPTEPVMPDSVAAEFRGQRNEEQLLLRQQRHIWAFWRSIFIPIFIGLAVMAIGFILPMPELLLVFIILGIVIIGVGIYYRYAEWGNDFIVITDQRVIHTEQTILSFQRRISEVPISSVQEVRVDIPASDIFARLLNYGSIFIRTAGEAGNMDLTLIPNPTHMQNVLLADKAKFYESAEQHDREAIGAVLDEYINPGESVDGQVTAPSAPAPSTQRPGLLSTRFQNEQGETVYRKHLTIWTAHVFVPTMFLVAALVLVVVGVLGLPTGNPLLALETLFGLFLGLIGLIWWFLSDWDWRNDMLVIGDTTVRIIHRRPLWLQDSNEQLLLHQVDNVDTKRDGLVNTLLNRGDVLISLVGDDQPKPFKNVSNPGAVQEAIFARRGAMLQQQKEAEVRQQRQEIAKYIGAYHERVQQQPTVQPAPQQQPPPTYWPPQQAPSTYDLPTTPTSPPPEPPGGARPPRVPRTRND